MLYQLSYASTAQTGRNYHTGIRIASDFLISANAFAAFYLQSVLPFLESTVYTGL